MLPRWLENVVDVEQKVYFSSKENPKMARDKYHTFIIQLLEEEGWTITHDPLIVKTALGNVEVKRQEPERILYLAILQTAYEFFFRDSIAEDIVKTNQLKFIVYNKKTNKIALWTN